MGALQLFEQFVVHAALAIGALQVLVVTRLCLFACCSCHRGFAVALICCARCSRSRGFAGAFSDMFVFICVLLLPSGLCRCLFMTRLPCGRVYDTFTLLNMLLLPSGFCLFELHFSLACFSYHRGFVGACFSRV